MHERSVFTIMMRDIPGYEGKYKINESGVVINANGHPLRYAKSNSGYLRVALEPMDEDGQRLNMSIHRLVAMTFLPNPDNLPVVMHIDNDKLHNHVSNLKWGTQSENIQQVINERKKHRPLSIFSEEYKNSRKKKETMIKDIKHPYQYEIYNEETKDSKSCRTRTELAETIGYSEISLKNMVGNGREISQGDYKGYKIRARTTPIVSPLRDYCI